MNKLIVVVDRFGWAIGNFALNVKKFCGDELDVSIETRREAKNWKVDKDAAVLAASIGLLPLRHVSKDRLIVRAASYTWSITTSRHLIEGVAAVLCCNNAIQGIWRQINPRAYFFPNAVDTQRFAPPPARPVDSPRLLVGIAGTLNRKEKGFRDIVLPAIRSCDPKQVELVCCGNDEPGAFIPYSDMPERFYHRLHAYLMASSHEGGPNTLLEAMACGVPCVATRTGIAPEIIRHGTNGWLEARTPSAFAKRIRWLIAHRKEVIDAGHEARKTAERFDWRIWKRPLTKLVQGL